MAKTVLIENRGRDTLDLGPIEVDGEKYHIRLGSTDDSDGAPLLKDQNGNTMPGQPGQWSDDFPNPVQEVEAKIWKAYLDDKSRGPMIRDLVNQHKITVNGQRSL